MATAGRETTRILGPGARVGGKYVLQRRIAEGGMGDVWQGRNEATLAPVALKVLRVPTEGRAHAEERFRREARLGSTLAHRGIVRVFDLVEAPDTSLVLVMELLRGETAEGYLTRRGPLPSRDALAIVAPLLSALHHGHENGVVHRDVKPANVFLALEPDGRVIPKLLDYGVAKVVGTGTKTIDGLVLGTPSYMSPEQIRGDEVLDARSDLFSVGVLLYELLTGVCPFEAKTPSAAIAAVLMHEVDPDPRIEPRLWLELQRALRKRPQERHASAAELAACLCEAVGETEDALTSVLRRTKPPLTFDTDEADELAPLSDVRVARESAETLSVEGQSLALAATWRKKGRRRVLVAAGVAAVVAVALLGIGLRRGSRSEASASSHVEQPSAGVPMPRVPSLATAASPPSASVTAPPSPARAVVASDPSVSPAVPVAGHAPRAVTGGPSGARKGPRAKPVATTPGF